MSSPIDMKQEMITVLSALQNHAAPLTKHLEVESNGRTYKVIYVKEMYDGKTWMMTKNRVTYPFACIDCMATFPGGNWVLISLKNGSKSEPSVRIHDCTLHHLQMHPEKEEKILSDESCKRVFSNQ